MVEGIFGVFGVLAFFLLLKVVYRVIDVVVDAVSLLCEACAWLYRGWKAKRAEKKENGSC